MMIALEPMPFRRWVALNPDVLVCTNCKGSGQVVSIHREVENCPACNGQGTLEVYDNQVRKKYERQIASDRLKKHWWKECFPYLFVEEIDIKYVQHQE